MPMVERLIPVELAVYRDIIKIERLTKQLFTRSDSFKKEEIHED